MRVWLKNNWKKVMVFLLVVGLLVWQPWQKWSISVADKEKVIDGNVRITGDLTVDGNETVKKNLDVDGQIKTKTDILAEGTIQGKTVQATKEIIAPEITANKITTKEVVTTTNNVVVTPVQTTSTVDQTGSNTNTNTGSENSFTSGDPQWNTGVGITKTVTLNVSPGKTAVVGGYTVNGVKGSLKIYQPGTYQLTICDGFIRDNIDPVNSQSTYQMKKDEAQRLGQDISNAQN